ncbi:MAG TPA: substrate-binding domain-containing protein [Bacteroidales bacterium]|jgi:phosphate transport system substrate-binding protein|nr:substrate-binding domain-containing protein [Bacteroidales bacterium]
MKTLIQLIIAISFAFSITTCTNEKTGPEQEEFSIPGLTMDNYPIIDGSTSTESLQTVIACNLFGISYSWIYLPWEIEYPYHILPSAGEDHTIARFLSTRATNHTGTHQAFVNLINGYVDLILVASTASDAELHLADSLDVNLIEAPIALDALVFLVNYKNPVNGLTTEQIKDIYTGKILNWAEVGGEDVKLNAYSREPNSGSQELMESLMMKDEVMSDLPDMMIYGMMGLINMIEVDEDGLGYSVNYYTRYMIRSEKVKLLEVDNYAPDNFYIASRKYGYTAEVYAIIRADQDKNSIAYKLFNLLQTPAGQKVVAESGYVPYN